jgi:hypothetical protein
MATRMQQRRGTASQWTSANPVLNAGEMGWESDTNKFKIGDGTNHWNDLDYFADINSTVNPAFGTSIVFEGATADSYETTLQVTDPTADRTITLPNVTGTVITTGNLSDITNIGVFTSTITMEGSSADDYELTLSAGNPTSDQTITFPDATGTVALTSNLSSYAPLNSPTFTGTVTLPANTISQSMMGDDSVGTNEIGGLAVTEAKIADGAVTSTKIANETIVNGDISASAAIALSKLATDPLARANHTGSQTASTISDFDTQVRTSKVTDLTAPTASFSMNSQKITSLATPTDSTDAATKAYVDAVTEGLHIHAAARAATTANVTLASALENGDTLDGITLATNDRILVKNQTTASENGIYIVQASGQPTRATDFDTATEVDSGDFIFVSNGTVNGSTGWVQTSKPATIGTDPITFSQFSGAGTYTAGTGLTLSGTEFSINTSTTVDLSTAQTLSNKTLASAIATTALTLNATGELRLADTDSSHYVGFKSPGTVAANKIWTLPSEDGTANQVLKTDGSGTLSWGTASGGGGASFSELLLIGA